MSATEPQGAERVVSYPQPPNIRLKEVNSSWIESIGYDYPSQTVAVLTTAGHLYHIDPVTPQEFADFEGDGSHGQYFNAHWKGKAGYRVSKVVQLG